MSFLQHIWELQKDNDCFQAGFLTWKLPSSSFGHWSLDREQTWSQSKLDLWSIPAVRERERVSVYASRCCGSVYGPWSTVIESYRLTPESCCWPHVHQHRYRLRQRACLVPANTTKTYCKRVLKEHEMYLTRFTFCNACSCSYCAWFVTGCSWQFPYVHRTNWSVTALYDLWLLSFALYLPYPGLLWVG